MDVSGQIMVHTLLQETHANSIDIPICTTGFLAGGQQLCVCACMRGGVCVCVCVGVSEVNRTDGSLCPAPL